MGLMNDILDDTIDENSLGTKVAENAQWRLWVNDMTKHYEKELDSYADNGFTLQGKMFVVLAENKLNGSRSYLALDSSTQEPIADWTTPSEFGIKRMLMLDDMKKDSDIVNMAKMYKKKKKKVKK